MGNSLKNKASKPNAAQLKPEKEAQVSIQEIVKDERTYKIAGALSLLMSLFLFTAFTSYLFTWQDDQDKVMQWGTHIFSADDIQVNNLLGVLGAYVAYYLIHNGFGIASYLLCTFFFVWGINLLAAKPIFNLQRNIRYVLVGLPVLSVTFSFFLPATAFAFGGGVGELLKAWLIKWIGFLGTGLLLGVIFFCYFIWRFNPNFSFLKRLRFKKKNKTEQSPATLHENASPSASNHIKTNNKGVVVIMPSSLEEASEEITDLNNFSVIEKENIEQEQLPNKELQQGNESNNLLTLEINDTKPDEAEEEPLIKSTVHHSTEEPYDPSYELSGYQYPTLDLLETHGSEKIVHDPAELEANKNQIIATLKNYDIDIQRITATIGPTVTLYEIVPAPGVRISRIKNLEDDIALSLAALGIRIIAPIPGKGTIGIEVPNVRKTVVSMKALLASDKFQNNNFSLPIALGKKIDNEHFIVDLVTMPHLLMAGATGQGKSVGINAILVSLLYKKHPSQLKFVLVDPKKVELSLYRTIEKHFLAKLPGEEEPIITDTKKVIYTLNALCTLMDIRYDLLKEAGCRNLKEYNEKFIKRKLNPQKGHEFLPFIVLVIDEFADLIMTAGKEIEMPLARLAQLARAVGIHLIIATQRPSVNIITGTIKANFPARIAFKVSSKIDSRTILDMGGAEQLIGKGDMLISYNGEISRLQCAFVDTAEVEQVCNFIGQQHGYPQAFLLPEYTDEKDLEGKELNLADRDVLFEEAARLIVQHQIGSTSLIQRRMKLGYNRAGRLMDQLEMAGIVGSNQGSKAREVLIKTEAELQEILNAIS